MVQTKKFILSQLSVNFPQYIDSGRIIFRKAESKPLGHLRISDAKTDMLSQAVSSLSKGFVVLMKPSSGLIVKNLSRSVCRSIEYLSGMQTRRSEETLRAA